MDQRDRICALCYARERYICGIAGQYAGFETFGILAAIWEKARIGGDADKDIALCAAQAVDVYFKRGACRRSLSRAA